jgi:hypothetical protein
MVPTLPLSLLCWLLTMSGNVTSTSTIITLECAWSNTWILQFMESSTRNTIRTPNEKENQSAKQWRLLGNMDNTIIWTVNWHQWHLWMLYRPNSKVCLPTHLYTLSGFVWHCGIGLAMFVSLAWLNLCSIFSINWTKPINNLMSQEHHVHKQPC